MPLFDTHAHMMNPAYKDDWDAFLARTLQNCGGIMNVGCNAYGIERAVALAEEHPQMIASVGLHPTDAKDRTDALWQRIEELALHPKVRAIGETGLDYHWDTATPEEQKALFIEHIELAKRVKKPLIIHDREAHRDCCDVLWQNGAEEVGGIFHAYSGSVEMMQEVVAHNFYIGLGGVVTFKNAKMPKLVAQAVPLDRLLLETDCPYLTPTPYRGERNEPSYAMYAAEEIARLRGVSVEEILEATWQNALRIFQLSPQFPKEILDEAV